MILVVAATQPELGELLDREAADVEPFACGVGPVEAAAATAARLATGRVAALLHVGVAGARRGSGLGVGALVVGGEAVYCDLVTRLAPRSARPAPSLVDAARRAVPGAPVVAIGTSARIGGSDGPPVEAMEGFAVLRAAQLAGVPAVEVRAISNEVEDERERWKLAEALGALAAAAPRLLAEVRACAS